MKSMLCVLYSQSYLRYSIRMKWIKTQEASLPQIDSSVVTVGNFDGVHLGHQYLLKELVKKAQSEKVAAVVCTFRPHPRTILYPEKPTHRLFDYRDQAEMMEKLGVDYLIEEKFTKDFSLMSGEEFLSSYIVRLFKPKHIVVGHDFNFGKNRQGDEHFLSEFCKRRDISLSILNPFEINAQVVSSSAIRKLLEHGDLQRAEEFLGRKYYLRGPVRVGHRRGRQLGVPTANISPAIEFVPRKGVYFTLTEHKNKLYPSISNIGYNPTFETEDSYLKVETHIFDFHEDIYGDQIKVELLHFHRDEMKFSGVEPLKKQIDKDILLAHDFFKNLKDF